ncbi:MAG: DUF4468 domain-containing protein [Prevotella sp.]|nr:DUF4468 domain-containing protein [Prevotella sp.]
MMKHILLALMLLMPAFAMAQSNLTPEQQLEKAKQEAEQARQQLEAAKKAAKAAKQKAKEDAKLKAAQNAEIQKQIEQAKAEAERYKAETEKVKAEAAQEAGTLTTQNGDWTVPQVPDPKEAQAEAAAKKQEESKDDKNAPRYLKGAVPQDAEGDVVFTLDLNVPGKAAQDIYQTTLKWMTRLVQGEEQINSRVALVNPKEHVIATTVKEWLTFRRNFISTDRTQFNYTLIANCMDNHLKLQMTRISYLYEQGRPSELRVSAEDWISDKKAINKKGTKLLNGSGKFRRFTIDRKDELFNQISALLK